MEHETVIQKAIYTHDGRAIAGVDRGGSRLIVVWRM
jgi:hypothetical protein